MKIGILQTGHSPDELRDEHGDYNEMFMRLLARPDVMFETFVVLADDFPAQPSIADAWVVTGSRCGVYDGFPWIAKLEAFLRDLHKARVPLVGICFGHQAIAEALGGKVEKFSGGWSCGMERYRFVGRDTPAALLAWHQDQIVVPPPGAEIIASSNFCRYAGLRFGEHTLTLQPHPEFSLEYMRALATARRAVIGDSVAASAVDSLSAGKPEDFGPYILDFIDAAIAAKTA
ncbi:MAG: type 1 glutamine amidotransferase [Proteobacteria bacterium]|nr:type 1 glutamine amidotransferase [Pseudomonadota bacterium]